MKWYTWIAIGALIGLLIVVHSYRKRQSDVIQKIDEAVKENKTLFTEQDARTALAAVAAKYGKNTAALIEKVARLETSHFKSRQYQLTGTGGMEAHGNAPYYGWYSAFFIANPQYTPVATTDMLEGKGASEIGGNAQSTKPKSFVIMPSVEAWMMFLADYADRYKNAGGILRWYSTDAQKQAIYKNTLNGIIPRIVNQLV